MDEDFRCMRALIFATIAGVIAWTGIIALIAYIA